MSDERRMCYSCREEKPITEFAVDNDSKHTKIKRSYECYTCSRKRNKRYRIRQSEEDRQKALRENAEYKRRRLGERQRADLAVCQGIIRSLEQRGFDLAAIAREAGIQVDTISQIRSAKRSKVIFPTTADKLCRAFANLHGQQPQRRKYGTGPDVGRRRKARA